MSPDKSKTYMQMALRLAKKGMGITSPNPMAGAVVVKGRGIQELAGAGIQIEKGILYPEAVRLNEIYSKFISTKTPFVILKSASSLDGRIALPSGESKWITGETARRYSHRLRAMVDAVLVGIGTVLADDPLLSVRDTGIKEIGRAHV